MIPPNSRPIERKLDRNLENVIAQFPVRLSNPKPNRKSPDNLKKPKVNRAFPQLS